MKVLIIEDEKPAAKRLTNMLSEAAPEAEILSVIDSVEDAVKWLQTFDAPELIFMDIQLADGLSFDIFTQVKVDAPVIFTTAYDQYTLKAFKVNSVDYLLKPIVMAELQTALQKFKNLNKPAQYDSAVFEELLQQLQGNSYKSRFLVKTGQQLSFVNVEEIAWCLSDEGVTCIITKDGRKLPVDYKLEELEQALNPDEFHRVNRKIILRPESINKIHTWFNSRLKLELTPLNPDEVIVSRERVADFKKWLDK